jgi:class 3 adenylate cyclase/tetratricopeptide (TPR) repeat protein
MKVVLRTESDTAKVRLIISAAQASRGSDSRKSVALAKQALEIAKKADFQWGIAMAHRVEGYAYYDLSEYPEALSQLEKALNGFEKLNDQTAIAAILNGMGAIFFEKGDDTKAIELYLKGMKIAEAVGDRKRKHTIETNLGAVYQRKEKTRDQAIIYYDRALQGFKDLGRMEDYRFTSANIGEIHLDNDSLKLAEKYFLNALEGSGNSLNDCFPLTKLGDLYARRGEFKKAEDFQNRSISIAEKMDGPMQLTDALIGRARLQVLKKDYAGAIETYGRSLTISKSLELAYNRRDIYKELARLHGLLGNFKEAFNYQLKLDGLKDTLFNTDEQNKIQQLQFNFDLGQKQAQLDLKDLRIRQQEYIGYGAAVFVLLLAVIAIVIWRQYSYARKTNAIIQAERDRSKELLFNILPEETAYELETNGFAKTRYYEQVSVLFTDFKGFSTIAGKLTPQALVAELNDYFVTFDMITDKNNLEKIKTIGDAYMCAGGLPTPDNNHAVNAVRAALAMQHFMQKQIKYRIAEGLQPWELRVGVHTGSVVAGVVGKKKYAYDIWGDTVNIASRMESTGEAGKVNISAATYEMVKEHFRCTYRGKLSAKNVGEIDMYFVEEEIILPVK